MIQGAAHHAIGVCMLRRHLIDARAVVGGVRQHKHLASSTQLLQSNNIQSLLQRTKEHACTEDCG